MTQTVTWDPETEIGYDESRQAARIWETSEDNQLESRHDAVMRTLAEGQPDCIMEAFMDPENHDILYTSLPTPTFVEAFRLLSPAYFIKEYIRIHRYFHPVISELKKYKKLRKITDEFYSNMTAIARMRLEAGHELGVYEFTHLLDCARSMGHGPMADEIWGDMLRQGVTPNLKCYNYFMEAKSWDNAYSSESRFALRVTPFNQERRSHPFRNPRNQGFRTGSQGVKRKVLNIFQEMTQRGFQGDEHSYVNLMVASARVGDVNGVKEILRAVWNIDVNLLSGGNAESHPRVKSYTSSSPLHPTTRLIDAVAHIFVTNNDLPSALQTVDFISQKYGITIPEDVWMDLLEWSFVLSVKRRKKGYIRNHNPGKIPPETVCSVFETMTSEPYNIKPTVPMYNLVIKTAWYRQNLPDMLKYMRTAFPLFRQSIETRNKKSTELSFLHPKFQALQDLGSHRLSNPWLKEYYTATHEYALLQLIAARDSTMVDRWARLLIAGRRHFNYLDHETFQREIVPRLFEEWKAHFPLDTYYQVNGGTVEFERRDFWEGWKKWPEEVGDIGLREKGELAMSAKRVEIRMDVARQLALRGLRPKTPFLGSSNPVEPTPWPPVSPPSFS
ncbi:hypothetical protein FQN54_006946 [Arachnomyces sp. PD_36]|nr:hypothetical protein FQN54_006946 [Arachnomyces sp. PD_36]